MLDRFYMIGSAVTAVLVVKMINEEYKILLKEVRNGNGDFELLFLSVPFFFSSSTEFFSFFL